MNVTLDTLTKDIMEPDVVPVETPSGGTMSTDFELQLTALMNRMTALELLVNSMKREDLSQKPEEPEKPEEVVVKETNDVKEETNE